MLILACVAESVGRLRNWPQTGLSTSWQPSPGLLRHRDKYLARGRSQITIIMHVALQRGAMPTRHWIGFSHWRPTTIASPPWRSRLVQRTARRQAARWDRDSHLRVTVASDKQCVISHRWHHSSIVDLCVLSMKIEMCAESLQLPPKLLPLRKLSCIFGRDQPALRQVD